MGIGDLERGVGAELGVPARLVEDVVGVGPGRSVSLVGRSVFPARTSEPDVRVPTPPALRDIVSPGSCDRLFVNS